MKIGNVVFAKPPIILAPMEDISDPPFRKICKDLHCDLVYTEFTSVQGLIRNVAKSYKKIEFSEVERPIGVQIFGSNVNDIISAVEIVSEKKPDIIDLNFGCPVKKIVNKKGGAYFLREPKKCWKLLRLQLIQLIFQSL